MNSYVEDNIEVVNFGNGKTNSITYDDLIQIKNAINKVNQVFEIQGLILTGAGPFFSSGFDLPTFLNFKTTEEAITFLRLGDEIILNLFSCTKPVIAAINGHCAAMGMMAAMAADYRIGANNPKIKMGMSEIRLGLALRPAMNATMKYSLETNRLFRDVMYFGKMYSIIEAHNLGMVDEITDQDNLLPRAKEIVSGWMNSPRQVFSELKHDQKKNVIQQIISERDSYDWEAAAQPHFDNEISKILAAVQKSMER